MKRVLFIIAIVLYTTSCSVLSMYSPYINLDRMEDKGSVRQIMSDSRDFQLDGAEYSFSIKVYDYGYYQSWGLLVSSYQQIPDDAQLLIKFGNDEVITLDVDNVNIGDVNVSSIYGYYKVVDYYSSIFALNSTHFEMIKDYGIKKIRISTPYSYRDKTFLINSLGDFITTAKKHIDKRLNTTRHKSIDEDF